jgi:ribosomal protein L40E
MDPSVLVAVLAGLVIPMLLLALFQLSTERLPRIREAAGSRTGMATRATASVAGVVGALLAPFRALGGMAVAVPRWARDQVVSARPGRRRATADRSARSVEWRGADRSAAVRADRSAAAAPFPRVGARPSLVPVGPGRPDLRGWASEVFPTDDMADVAARDTPEPTTLGRPRPGPADGRARVRITTTGLDGRSTVLDDEIPTVACPRCGYRHSSEASYCRRCGYSQSNRPLSRWQVPSANKSVTARRGRG